MSRFATQEVEDSVSCNLIPMIDIMFLLLLFFMLSADMSTREMEELKLPEADQAQEDKNEKTEDGMTTINVHHRMNSDGPDCPRYETGKVCNDEGHWKVTIRSRDFNFTTLQPFLQAEAEMEQEEPDPATGKRLSKRHAMIRSDRLAMFGYVQKVMESCATAGIYKIQIAAARPMP